MRPLVPAALLLLVAAPLAAQTAPAPAASDPRLAGIAAAVSADSLRATDTRLVGFGTRHTLSDTLSPTRGIGAARRWVKARFDRISAACGGCLDVFYVSGMVGPAPRVPRPTEIVDVVAVQRGTADSARYVLLDGHLDSRVADVMDATDSAPGADDDGSGVSAVLEAARVLTRHRFAGTIVYAVCSGEEQGLYGGKILAQWARQHDWRLVAMIENDMIGNDQGSDGITDNATARIFSDGTPPTLTGRERTMLRFTGGDDDGISRQLARYLKTIAEQYVPGLHVWLIYRLDRFLRGGDHQPFADLGYPAVRFTEMHENYTRQHNDVRVVDGVQHGDLLSGVDFDYARRITAADAATLASLSWAPAPPREARLGGAVEPAAILTWEAPADSADIAGYRVYWRRTDAPTWDHWTDVGKAHRWVFAHRVVDDYFFGVASVNREGDPSVVVFPTPAIR